MAIRVKDELRTNDLSLTPGGSEVKTIMQDGKDIIYDKIKYVKGYCKRLMADPKVIEIHVDGELYWKRN